MLVEVSLLPECSWAKLTCERSKLFTTGSSKHKIDQTAKWVSFRLLAFSANSKFPTEREDELHRAMVLFEGIEVQRTSICRDKTNTN
jgi:hypothetical protein